MLVKKRFHLPSVESTIVIIEASLPARIRSYSWYCNSIQNLTLHSFDALSIVGVQNNL